MSKLVSSVIGNFAANFSSSRSAGREPRPGQILDYDKSGRLVSLELLAASERVNAPRSVEFALAGS